MADKIKKSDLFAENPFPTPEAYGFKTAIDAIVIAQDKLIEQKMKLVQGVNFVDSKSIIENNKAIKEGNSALLIGEKVKQAQIRTNQLLEKQTIAATKAQEKLNSEYTQAANHLSRLEKRQLDNVIAGRELSKTGRLVAASHEELRVKVEGAERGVGRFQRNVGNYSQELRKLQKELQGLEPGTKQFNELAKKAGELKDKINDASSATKAFASSSKLTQGKTLFGQIFGDIADLNFQGAADKAKQFASVIGSISFKEIAGGIKNLGSSLLDLGKAAFLNPLTAVASGIALLGFALKDTYESWQRTIHFSDEFAASLNDLRKKTDDLTKSTRDLRIENSNLSDDEKSRIKASNKFKDEYINIKTAELSEIKKINNKFKEESKIGTGEAILGSVGNLSNQLRIKDLLKARAKAIVDIQAETGRTLGALQENYTEELKGTYKKDADNKKKAEDEKVKTVKESTEKQIKIHEAKGKLDDEDFKKKKKQLEEEARLLKESDDKDILQGRVRADRRERELQAEIKVRSEIARIEKELLDTLDAAVQQRQEKNNEAINQEISNRERSISEQQSLAERGAENTLAFEKAQLAKSELAKKQEAERQRRQDEAIKLSELFLNSLNGKLADGKTSYLKASSEALAETFAAKGLSSVIAGSFFEGTEKVEDDLKGNKMHNGRDGYLIAADGKERILTGAHNSLLGDMSNEEVVRRALMNPEMPVMANRMVDSIMLHQMIQMNKGVNELKDVIKSRPVQQSQIDSHGNLIEIIYKNNEKIVTTFMNKNRRSGL